MRSGDWKLIEHFGDGRLELFNLADDPGETNDIAEGHPAQIQVLHAQLSAWRDDVEALIPKPNPNWVAPELPEGVDPAEV